MSTKGKEHRSAGDAGASQAGARMMVTSRYAECLHRLARQAGHLDPGELARKLSDVANLIEEMADEIEADQHGAIVLRKAGRLIGTVEAVVDRAARRATLH